MSDPDEIKPAAARDRIRWRDEERGHAGPRRRSLSRRVSTDSLGRAASRRQVDPAVTLPIEYRTVSFHIEESKGKEQADKAKAKNTTAQEVGDLEWHTLSTAHVEQRLTTSPTEGLSADQAERRLQQYGKNAPSPPKSDWGWKIFGYFFKGFGSVLLIGSILVFVSWKPLGDPPAIANLALAIVLLAVFFIQAGFAMFQDWSTSRVMSSIKDLLPEHCQVVRGGQLVRIPGEDIVPGDLLMVKSGDKLPADMRFIQVSSDAKFDRSVLTGESKPVAAAIDHTDENYLETRNIGLQGTHCILGSCTGVVVATGDKTIFGRIAALTNEPKTKMTTLERELLYFVALICGIMVIMIVLVLAVWGGWLRKDHPDYINVATLIVDCVSVAVAFIPEGLPLALTLGLTITANLMKSNAILCKSLKTVETLGSVSVICSDKTGTLTKGKMTVSECSIAAQELSIEAAQEQLKMCKSTDVVDVVRVNHTGALQLRALAALCNAAELDAADAQLPLDKRRIFGDATDTAILRFAEVLEPGCVAYLRACWTKVYDLAFNSKNKFMIRCFVNARRDALPETLSEVALDGFKDKDLLFTMKGAPDVIIERCSTFVGQSGDSYLLDDRMRRSFESVKNMYSNQGKRCLFLARKLIPRDQAPAEPGSQQFEDFMMEQSRTGLQLVGLVAIVDPLRPEIRDVVSTLRGAGIRINMVTGDYALTAVAIARDAGIVTASHHDTVANLPRAPPSTASSFITSGGEDDEEGVGDAGDPEKPKATSESTRKALVISGPELVTLNDYQWRLLTEYREIVFARTTPEQKLRIVREFQTAHVVAMTGDGVNDAPSLRQADVGISLSGASDIAMEAADMVLLESFSSVVVAVQYGRVVFDNLKKVIAYLLPAGSFSEFWPVMTSVVFGLPQILSSFLMIIICCFTDCAAATILSYERPEADVLTRRPRNVKKDRLVNWQLIGHAYGLIGIIETLASFAMSYWYLERQGIRFKDLWFSFGEIPAGVDEDYYADKLNVASSIYFVNLVVMQWFNLIATRTRRLSLVQHPPFWNRHTRNWYIVPAVLFSLVMAIFWLYVPAFQRVLDTAPVPVEHWFLPFAFGLFILLVDETRKYIVRRWPGSILARSAW